MRYPKIFPVRLTPQMAVRLREFADAHQMSESVALRLALTEFFERRGPVKLDRVVGRSAAQLSVARTQEATG